MNSQYHPNETIMEREKGQFPISIATSLALESLLNIHPDTKHDKVLIGSFDQLWVNIRTLFRNIYTAMQRTDAEKLSAEDYAYAMQEEMYFLREWGRQAEVSTAIVFYHSKYANFNKLYPSAKFRVASTMIQQTYQAKTEATINKLFEDKVLIEGKEGNVLVFKNMITPENTPNAALLTHYAYDLLRDYSFSNLLLLESHTGALKPKSLWYTKYATKDIPPIPLRIELLQVFGDKEMFRQMPKGIREYIIGLAKQYKWTPMTSKDRMFQSISFSKEAEYFELFKTIFNRNVK